MTQPADPWSVPQVIRGQPQVSPGPPVWPSRSAHLLLRLSTVYYASSLYNNLAMRALLLAVAASLARPSAAVHPLPPHRLFAIFNGRSDAFPGYYLAGRAPWLKQRNWVAQEGAMAKL